MNQRQVTAQVLRVSFGHFDSPSIRGNHHDVTAYMLLEIALKDWGSSEVVEWEIEEALDLSRVKIDGHDTINTCGLQHVGY